MGLHRKGWQTIDSTTTNLSTLISQLQMSFLGTTSSYWLRDIGDFADKDRKQLLAHIRGYTGPNVLLFFSSTAPTSFDAHAIIELPDLLDKKLFLALLELENPTVIQRNSAVIKEIFAHAATISLDTACILIRYMRIIGNNQQEFIRTVLGSLISQETSLFTLSQYFFAKQTAPFFSEWTSCAQQYGELFWITFWSEQLWRTHGYVRYMQQNKIAEAKSIAYRLPFSLVQRDWKKISLHEVQSAHTFLYELDYTLKNGGPSYGLDLFYAKFLSGEFNS